MLLLLKYVQIKSEYGVCVSMHACVHVYTCVHVCVSQKCQTREQQFKSDYINEFDTALSSYKVSRSRCFKTARCITDVLHMSAVGLLHISK